MAARWIDLVLFPVMVVLAVLYGPRQLTWYAGLFLAAVSALPWFVARQQLGGSFTGRAAAQQLVTTGMYSKLRHPVYVFGSLAYIGLLLALLEWSGLIFGAVIVVVEIVRARKEDRVLADAFGAEYEAWRARTWF